MSYAGPVYLWLLLAITASRRSHTDELTEILDQAEPAVHGAWSGDEDELDNRARVALAHVVAKSAGSERFDVLRDILVSAGVVDWITFYLDVIHGSARFRWNMAVFQPRSSYRWVSVDDIPVIERPHRLTQDLAADWDAVATRRHGLRRRQPSREDVKRQWVERQQENHRHLSGWGLFEFDWVASVDLVREFWKQHDASTWTVQRARQVLSNTEDLVQLGALLLLVDPIVWSPDSRILGNGRHRVLALSV